MGLRLGKDLRFDGFDMAFAAPLIPLLLLLAALAPFGLGVVLAEASGFPQDVLRTEEEVEQLIQAERQAAQQQQMAEMAKTGSEAARNMNAPIEEGSPLEAVTGHLVA